MQKIKPLFYEGKWPHALDIKEFALNKAREHSGYKHLSEKVCDTIKRAAKEGKMHASVLISNHEAADVEAVAHDLSLAGYATSLEHVGGNGAQLLGISWRDCN